MTIKHIFISHAGPDAELADQIAEHLRNAGHHTKVDTHDLSLGDDSITFMNNCIAEAKTVLILFSKHSAKAKWQKLEMSASLWNEVEQGGGLCVVARLDDSPLPPILGPKVFRKLAKGDRSGLGAFIEEFCRVVLREEPPSSLIAEALKPDTKNPFRHLRAEYFENEPELHARAFAPPEALKIGVLEEMKPCFLEGSRGTGKSMLLLSMRARNFILRAKSNDDKHRVFGFYLKLSRGAICNIGLPQGKEGDVLGNLGSAAAQVIDIASQELIVQLLESLLSELKYCFRSNTISFDIAGERKLAEALGQLLFRNSPAPAVNLDDLLERMADAHKSIAEYIRRKFIYGESPTVPFAIFDLAQFKRALAVVRNHVNALTTTLFVALLDEYENLFEYQQRVVNGIVKLGLPDFSVKIAKKLGSGDTSGTTTGQDLQEIHDYARITLVYDVGDPSQEKAYRELLKHIVANILRSETGVHLKVEDLLPEDSSDEVLKEQLEVEVLKLCKVTRATFQSWSKAKQKERFRYYKNAGTFRVLLSGKGRHAPKRYSGFGELALLSSGVIRYFQEILGVAYHLSFGLNAPKGAFVIPPSEQSKAVHLVSQHNLTTLSRNVEAVGEELKYFLLDLGDCLRHRLLRHGSEPEAARITIKNPEELEHPPMSHLKKILSIGIREGVFQTKEGMPAFKPKHNSDPQPTEFNISRIFAPVLEISPILRWRTPLLCEALSGLLGTKQRAKAIQHIKSELAKDGANTQSEFGFKGDSG